MPAPAPDPSWFNLLTPAQQILLQGAIALVVLTGMVVRYMRSPGQKQESRDDVVLPSLSIADMKPWRETAETSKLQLEESRKQTDVLCRIEAALNKANLEDEIERRIQAELRRREQ